MTSSKKYLAAVAMLASFNAAAQSTQPVVTLIATGGTIAMKIDPVKRAPVPAISGEDLPATVPDVADDLSPAKASILLMLALQSGVAGQRDLQAVFSR